jgi:hypothetical protein
MEMQIKNASRKMAVENPDKVDEIIHPSIITHQ